MQAVVKLTILLLALAGFWLLGRTRCGQPACARFSGDHRRAHRKAAHAAFGVTLLLAGLVELLKRFENDPHPHPWLPWHLALVIPFVLVLAVQAFGPRQWRIPQVETALPLVSLALYAGTFLTGLALLAGD